MINKKQKRIQHIKNNKENYYINQDILLEEIKLYKKTGQISEKLGEMLILIAKKFATKSCFNGYTYKDDFIADAVARMIEQLHKIDLKHKNCNPFSYLTQMCYWKFVSKINDEKKHSNTKDELVKIYISQYEKNVNNQIKDMKELSKKNFEKDFDNNNEGEI